MNKSETKMLQQQKQIAYNYKELKKLNTKYLKCTFKLNCLFLINKMLFYHFYT